MFVGTLDWKLGAGRVFGLDISYGKMAVTVFHPSREIEQYEVVLDEAGLRTFLQDLRPHDRVALEATGNTWYLYARMKPLVADVAVADARKLKLIAHSQAKTDRNDSYILALLLTLGLLPTVWMPDPETQGDRELLRCRGALLGKITRVKNQARSTLARHGLAFDKASLHAEDGQLFLATLGNRLPAAAQQSLASLLRELEFLESELRIVDAQVRVRAERWGSQLELLQTIPGVGLLVAFTMLAVIGDVTRFKEAKSLGNYSGACPVLKASGDQSWSGGITKAGPCMLRWALTEAALSLTRSNGYFRNLYRRIKRGRKNRHGIAIVACVRELAETVWRMLTCSRAFHDCVPGEQEKPQERKRQREARKLEAARLLHAEQPDGTALISAHVGILLELCRRS